MDSDLTYKSLALKLLKAKPGEAMTTAMNCINYENED